MDVLFLLACLLLIADVLVPEIWGSGKSKDYSLWFWAGEQIRYGQPLYERMTRGTFDFIYPPVSAILLALPTWFGKAPFYFFLSLLNVAAWWITGELSNAMTGSQRTPSPWLAALPGVVMVAFVFDQFDLGQPNLFLLALMLGGFWSLQKGRPVMGGFLFALATAIKAFPIAVLPYLVWRRQWKASAGLIVWLGVLLLLVPAPIRGFERNLTELTTWYQGMVGSTSDQGFGQRSEQNWSWINQSVIAITHRLVRPVDYNHEGPKPTSQNQSKTMNIISVDFKTANVIVLAVMALIGLGFIAVLPARHAMTPRSTADELGILFCLMTIASPLARQYYFIWLYFPVTVLMQRAVFDPRETVRTRTWGALLAAAALLLLSLPVFPKLLQALGNNLAATFILIAALIWHMRHPPTSSQVEPGIITT